MREPWEVLVQIRLADSGEIRECLEKFKKEDVEGYARLESIFLHHKFKRTSNAHPTNPSLQG